MNRSKNKQVLGQTRQIGAQARSGRIPAILELAFSERLWAQLTETLGDADAAEARILDLVQHSIRPPRSAGLTLYTSETEAVTWMKALHPYRAGTRPAWHAAIFDLRPGIDSPDLQRYPYIALAAQGDISPRFARLLPAVIESLRGWSAQIIVIVDETMPEPEARWEELTEPVTLTSPRWNRVLYWQPAPRRTKVVRRHKLPLPLPEPELLPLLIAEPV
jgi:hypothetical protein